MCVTNQALLLEVVWGSGCIEHVFLTSGLFGGEWISSRLGHFNLEREPQIPIG
jgi:hypothetical protein